MSDTNTDLRELMQSDFLEDRLALPIFPGVALKVAREVNKPSSTARSAAEIVAEDPILSGRVLAVANSSGFPGNSKTVQTLPTAVGRLGLYGTRNVVMAFSIKQMTNHFSPRYRQLHQSLIFEAQQLAAMAHTIASSVPNIDAETALAQGLLCDIGKIPVLSRIDNLDREYSLSEARQACDELHPMIGGWVLSSWKMWQDLVLLPTFSHHWFRATATPRQLTVGEIITAAKIVLYGKQNDTMPNLFETPIGRTLIDEYGLEIHDDGTLPSALNIKATRKQSELLAA